MPPVQEPVLSCSIAKMRMPRILRLRRLGIGILVVHRRLAGLGVDGVPEPHHGSAHGLAAFRHADVGIAVGRKPGADQLLGARRRCGGNEHQRKHDGRCAAKGLGSWPSGSLSVCLVGAPFLTRGSGRSTRLGLPAITKCCSAEHRAGTLAAGAFAQHDGIVLGQNLAGQRAVGELLRRSAPSWPSSCLRGRAGCRPSASACRPWSRPCAARRAEC